MVVALFAFVASLGLWDSFARNVPLRDSDREVLLVDAYGFGVDYQAAIAPQSRNVAPPISTEATNQSRCNCERGIATTSSHAGKSRWIGATAVGMRLKMRSTRARACINACAGSTICAVCWAIITT